MNSFFTAVTEGGPLSRASGAPVYGNRISIGLCYGIVRRETIATASVNIDNYAFKCPIALKSIQMRRYRIKSKGKRVLAALRDSG